MPKRRWSSINEIEDAYSTPDEYESRDDRKRRKAKKRQAINRFMNPEVQERKVESQAVRRSTMNNEELLIAREQSRARMAIHRSQADGTIIRAISTIEEHTGNIKRHSIGEMTVACPHCHALKWKEENKSLCCLDGRVLLAPPNDPPAFVKKFVETPALLRQIRAYNNALGLTSMGATVCDNVAIDTVYASGRQGVYTFRVQGTICHRIGTLLPEDGAEPSFAQVYVYDGNMEHQVDRRMKIIDGLDRTTANDVSSQ